MADHYRKTIRDALINLLIDKTAAQARVYPLRIKPIADKDIPTIQVYTLSERSGLGQDGQLLERECNITIEFVVRGSDADIEAAGDSLCAEIEAAVTSNPTLGNLLGRELILIRTSQELAVGGPNAIMGGSLEYVASYFSELRSEGEPGVMPNKVWVIPNPNDEGYRKGLDELQAGNIEVTYQQCDPVTGCAVPAWKGEVQP